MKKVYAIAILFICVSCAIERNTGATPFLALPDKEVKNGNTLTLQVKNDSGAVLFFPVNEDPNYYRNYLFIKAQKLASTFRIIVEDETGTETNLQIERNTLHFDDYDEYKNEVVNKGYLEPALKEVAGKKYIEIKIPFNMYSKDPYTGYLYQYALKEGKKYFVRIQYTPDPKVMEKFRQRGIKVYDKALISNKVPLTLPD
ncbi:MULTISPECIES: hypothetical protein [unclassified Flavobacterium]|uniref:hypothetical protein n=1 Tax=unclassified Flavobacterium TaxID=196869 RepID=UPI001F12F014|nr:MULTISPECIES: hypothetical protein [unclassified Flavobacterium]UMY66529.1 hypothetical protein MKO97_03860 [Flavobacterium sp. HJ-32-4]